MQMQICRAARTVQPTAGSMWKRRARINWCQAAKASQGRNECLVRTKWMGACALMLLGYGRAGLARLRGDHWRLGCMLRCASCATKQTIRAIQQIKTIKTRNPPAARGTTERYG